MKKLLKNICFVQPVKNYYVLNIFFIKIKFNNHSVYLTLKKYIMMVGDFLLRTKQKNKFSEIDYLKNISKKLSLVNDICRVKNTLFYVPNFPADLIQRRIVNSQDFYSVNLLRKVDSYIPENATILDIGSNIGNHTLYWSKVRHASKVYAFEPVPETFKILLKNIEINNLQDIVTAQNVGLGSCNSNAQIVHFDSENIGGTALKISQNGQIQIRMLDDIKLDLDRIDLIKIDVEGHELEVLKGSVNTLNKYKPDIFVEVDIFDNSFSNVKDFLTDLGYKIELVVDDNNILYKHSKKVDVN